MSTSRTAENQRLHDSTFGLFWVKQFHDLLPVIPAGVGAKNSGKCPGIWNGRNWEGRDRKVFNATEVDIEEWAKWGAGVGIRCHNGIVGLDIDSLSQFWSGRVQAIAFEVLGKTAIRIGQAPKRLLAYRARPSTHYRQIMFDDGVIAHGARVELLAGPNSWFVAHGIHPKTNAPYTWPDGVWSAAQLPEIAAEDLDILFTRLKDELPMAKGHSSSGVDRSQIDQMTLLGDVEKVTKAMACIPNDAGRVDYHAWIRMAAALRAALQHDQDWGCQLFEDWSYKADILVPKVRPDAAYWSVTPPFAVGAQYVYDHAEMAGWGVAEKWFVEPPLDPWPDRDSNTTHKSYAFVDPLSDQLSLEGDLRPLVKGLLDKTAMSVVYGDSNSGKTSVCLDVAYHVAMGLPWAGMKTEHGLVVYVALEGGRGIRRRVRALMNKYNSAGLKLRLLMSSIDLRRADADTRPLIAALKALGEPILLIVVDTLARAMGGGDENAATDMGLIVRHGDLLRQETGAHLMFIHHTGKDKAKGARGHSSLRAATDTEIEINAGRIEVTKQRDMEGGWSSSFTLESQVLGVAADGDPITSCTVCLTTEDKVKAGRPTHREDQVIAALKGFDGGASMAELVSYFQLDDDRKGKSMIRSVVYRLLNKRCVRRMKNGRFALSEDIMSEKPENQHAFESGQDVFA